MKLTKSQAIKVTEAINKMLAWNGILDRALSKNNINDAESAMEEIDSAIDQLRALGACKQMKKYSEIRSAA